MNSIKLEIIGWIVWLENEETIRKLLTLKRELSRSEKDDSKIFGSGKHLVEYISDDFNEPLKL